MWHAGERGRERGVEEDRSGRRRGRRGAWKHVSSFFGPNAGLFVLLANEHVRHSQMAAMHFVYAASLILQPLLWFPRCRPTCLSFAPPCLFAVTLRVRPGAQQTKAGRVFLFSKQVWKLFWCCLTKHVIIIYFIFYCVINRRATKMK